MLVVVGGLWSRLMSLSGIIVICVIRWMFRVFMRVMWCGLLSLNVVLKMLSVSGMMLNGFGCGLKVNCVRCGLFLSGFRVVMCLLVVGVVCFWVWF